jgi:uncharacterized RDD family membrane protein YckC
MNSAAEAVSPGLLRRLAAIVYDGLLLAAIFFFAGYPYIALVGGAPAGGIGRLGLQFYLLAIAFVFFGWFWVHGGQTLGMRAWRLRLVSAADNGPVSWRQSAIRFAAALLSWLCLGLGFVWIVFDREKRAWHDRLSGTCLLLLPKPPRRGSGQPPQ